MRGAALKKFKTIKLSVIFVLTICILLLTFTSACSNSKYTPIIEECRAMISEVMDREKIPGLAIALIEDNKIVWTEGFGYTDLDNGSRVTPETIFSIQSASKTITATAEMIAVQDGLVDLDKPISEYIPDFTVNSRYDEKSQDNITIRHLLSHRAGFTQEAPVGNNFYPESPSFEAHVKSISDTWLRYPIGQRYAYSNLGIDLAGYILQVKSGNSFSNYVKEKLLDPIGMKNSSFDMDIIKKNPNRAIGHCMNMPISNVPVEVPMIPSGGFYSNARDMAKFVQFHLKRGEVKGKSILKPELIDEMYTIPWPVTNQYQGYALGVVKAWNSTNRVFYYIHGGGGFGFLFNMVWFPDYEAGFVILTNSDNNTTQSDLTGRITDLILKQKQPTYNAAYDEDKIIGHSAPVNAEDPKKNAGVYLGRSEKLTVSIDDPNAFSFNNNEYKGKYISPDIYVIGDTYYSFIPEGEMPVYVLRSSDGETWDYNDGPNDKPGPDKQEWNNYTGTYVATMYGQFPLRFSIDLMNGYLYCIDPAGNQLKLYEYKPRLFFSATGESLDFRGETPMFANLRVQKEK